MVKKQKKVEFKDLNLEDDFLFAKVMSDKDVCKEFLEKLLNIEITKIEIPENQKTIDLLLDSKGIRLDIYVKDQDDTVYNVEMQRGKHKNLPKRLRYYQGNIDLDLLSKGKNYNELAKSFIIFLSFIVLFIAVSSNINISSVKSEADEIDLGDISNNNGYVKPNEEDLQFEKDNAEIITDSSQLENEYNASKHTISGFSEVKFNKNNFNTIVSNVRDTDIDVIRQAITNDHVLSFSTDIDGWNLKNIESNQIIPENNNYLGEYIATYVNKPDKDNNHEMTIVGYDDDIWVDINVDNVV